MFPVPLTQSLAKGARALVRTKGPGGGRSLCHEHLMPPSGALDPSQSTRRPECAPRQGCPPGGIASREATSEVPEAAEESGRQGGESGHGHSQERGELSRTTVDVHGQGWQGERTQALRGEGWVPGPRGAPQRRETQSGHILTCPGPQEINKSMSQEVRSGVAHVATDTVPEGRPGRWRLHAWGPPSLCTARIRAKTGEQGRSRQPGPPGLAALPSGTMSWKGPLN